MKKGSGRPRISSILPMRDLNREVRQRRKARQVASCSNSPPAPRGDHRDDRPEMPRPQTPEMQVGDLVALALDGLAQLAGHVAVGVHAQIRSCEAQEP
jgi:hypothetical protein